MLIRFLRSKLDAYRAEKRFKDTNSSWTLLREKTPFHELHKGVPRKLVIVPSDPWTLIGAKGDEAMIQSVVTQLRDKNPEVAVGVITASEMGSDAARQLGYEPIPVWNQTLPEVIEAIRAFKADSLAVLGADCMDGYYSSDTTLRLLSLADVATRYGIRSTILGFSFNNAPDPRLANAFNLLSDRVSVNVRDEISLARLNAFCKAKTQLVTDSAFMLQPISDSSVVMDVERWAAKHRSEGRTLIGFNAHPMLIKNPTQEQLNSLFDTVASALTKFMKRDDVAVALISHDYRGASGDDTCLKYIAHKLASSFGDRLYYREVRCSAAELKGIAGVMDGIVTGRMHLAIASLGMGVPVAALTYQDKFQGLMRHFSLPDDLLLAPEKLLNDEPLVSLLERFTQNLEQLNEKVSYFLPQVKANSAKNVAALLT